MIFWKVLYRIIGLDKRGVIFAGGSDRVFPVSRRVWLFHVFGEAMLVFAVTQIPLRSF